MDNEIKKLKKEIEDLKSQVSDIKQELEYISFSVENVLRRRGFNFFSSCPSDDLLIPNNDNLQINEKFYEYFKKYSFRLFMRDIIKNKNKILLDGLTRFCSERTVKKYLNFLLKAGMIVKDKEGHFELNNNRINTFGSTLEWFVAKVFSKEFHSFADWRIKILNLKCGGDFDVIAILEGLIVFVEVKSSPPKHIHQNVISEFFMRMNDLNPNVAIFFIDTHLRLKDKINVMFEWEFRKNSREFKIENFYSKIFCVNNNVFIVNSKPDIITNIRECLKYYFSNKTAINYKFH